MTDFDAAGLKMSAAEAVYVDPVREIGAVRIHILKWMFSNKKSNLLSPPLTPPFAEPSGPAHDFVSSVRVPVDGPLRLIDGCSTCHGRLHRIIYDGVRNHLR